MTFGPLGKLLVFPAIFTLIFFTENLQSQTDCDYSVPGETAHWIFGYQAAVNFVDGQPVNSQSIDYKFPNGMSVMSDSTGNLLFYTDGMYVWNRNHELMQNGQGLKGNNGATQSCIIVPHPGDEDHYYIFTVSTIVPFLNEGFRYHEISMAANNGLGAVVNKNELLLDGATAEKLTAVQHSNWQDYWIITHGWGNTGGDSFYSFLLNENGLDSAYVTSQVGVFQSGDLPDRNEKGYMKVSPDGSKIALAINGSGTLEILDFNRETGELSNPVSADGEIFNEIYGVEFSPDSRMLYYTTLRRGGAGLSGLYQLDFSGLPDLNNTMMIAEYGPDSLMTSLQLAPDGKIYVSQTILDAGGSGKNALAVIYNPKRPGQACNFNQLGGNDKSLFDLGDGSCRPGLPNFVQSFLDTPAFYPVNVCYGDTTILRIVNTANIDSTNWNFNDPEGQSMLDDYLNPTHIFSDTGVYTINLKENYSGEEYAYQHDIRIKPLPEPEIGFGLDTVYIKKDSWIRLDPGEYDLYHWSDGSTDRYLDVSQEGMYTVEVVDFNCCRNIDSVYISFAETKIPNAFRPNSTLGNNKFRVLGKISGAQNYRFAIYNRWGQLMYETDSYTEGWDGTFRGQECPKGVYVWMLTYNLREGDNLITDRVVEKGTVTLVR